MAPPHRAAPAGRAAAEPATVSAVNVLASRRSVAACAADIPWGSLLFSFLFVDSVSRACGHGVGMLWLLCSFFIIFFMPGSFALEWKCFYSSWFCCRSLTWSYFTQSEPQPTESPLLLNPTAAEAVLPPAMSALLGSQSDDPPKKHVSETPGGQPKD